MHRLHDLFATLSGERNPPRPLPAPRNQPGPLHEMRFVPAGLPGQGGRTQMSAVQLTIDGRPVEVQPGQTLLDAARKLGIDIPTLCFLEKCTPATSCLVCLVKMQVNGQGRMVPSCATKALPGMVIESETP